MPSNPQRTRRVGLAILVAIFALPLHAEITAPKANAPSVAGDADVLGAERLSRLGLEHRLPIEGSRESPLVSSATRT